MQFFLKKRLKSLTTYFSSSRDPVLLLSRSLDPIYKNKSFRDICHDDVLEKIVEHLFEGKDSFQGYKIKSHFLAKYKVYVCILEKSKPELYSVSLGKEFIANASHELRTPITIIKGFAETLLDIKDLSKDMLDSIVQKIVNSSYRMQGLINNLLLLSDLDQTDTLKKKSVEVMSLVEKAIDELLLMYPEARIECFYANDAIFMQANQELLILSIFNILQNAVKYAKKDPFIEVVINREDKGFFISIKDNGMGMPKDQLARIFERFKTVDKSHSRKLGGAGLGLSLVDTIIKRHEGTICVESELEKGTQIVLHFR